MASLIGSLFVSLTADFNPFQRNMKAAEGVVASTSSGIRRNMGLTEKSVSGFQRSMNSSIKPYALLSAGKAFDTVSSRAGLLRGALFATTAAFGGLTAAISTNVFSRYVDQFTGLQNQLKTTSSGTADLNAQMTELQKVAERSRSSLAAVGTTYARIAKASPEEGSANTLRRVETIAKGLQLGGATAQEAYSATIQLSQGLASNRLGGEELRAVLETPLGNELAKGLGVSIAKFREMSIAGKLTAKTIYQALDARAGAIDKAFAETTATIDQSLTVLDSKITAYAGAVDKAYGVTRLLTGGINSFGDNLDTIIPLLATAAASIGILFAGRLAGNKIGGGLTSLVGGIKAVTEARKEALNLAREDVGVAQTAFRVAQQQASQARKKASDDPISAAPKSAVSAYKRDLNAIETADKRYLGVIEQKRRLNQDLYSISQSMTTAELKASQKLAEAQQKLNDLRAKAIVPQARRADAANRVVETVDTGPGKVRTRGMEAAAREQIALAEQIKKAEASLAAARQGYTDKYNASFTAAANQRAAILVNEKKLTADLDAAQAARAKAVAAARASGATARGTGASNIAAEIADATRNVSAAEVAVARAGATFTAAQKATGYLATGIGLVGRAGASLVGFLGGPWGVAFTAAIGLMTYLGLRSQETATKIANAQKVINDAITRAQERGGQDNPAESVDVQAALQAEKLAEQQKLIDTATEELTRLRGNIADDLSSLLNAASALPNGDEAVGRLREMIQQFRDGKMSIDEFKKGLEDVGFSKDQIAEIGKDMQKAKGEIDKATGAIAGLKQELASLSNIRPQVSVDINVNDPMGILNGSFFDKKFDREAQEAKDRADRNAARGGMQESSRKANYLATQQQGDILKAQGDKGQEIRDRTQALLEQNSAYGLTRDAAEKWARSEIAAKDATAAAKKETKDAAKEAGAAAREYEKFANKLAELKATAEASGLSDLDQQVVHFAESLKNGSQMMKDYIAAINSGDLSKAPKELLEARDAFQQIGAGEAAKGIIQQYGEGAQVAQLFADKQEQLNIAVANGQITASQAGVAFGDFVSTFGQYQWVDDMANAFTNFASSALNDFDNIGEAAKNLLKDIANIILKAALLDPLKNSLTSFFSGIASGGAGGGGGLLGGGGKGGLLGGFLIPGILHSGGTAGVTKTPTRAVPAATFNNAPKFHSGVGTNEMAAILQKGEAVLTERQTNRWSNTMRGLSNQATKAPKPTRGDFQININGARGNAEIREMVEQGVAAGLDVYDRHTLPDSVKRYNNDPSRRG